MAHPISVSRQLGKDKQIVTSDVSIACASAAAKKATASQSAKKSSTKKAAEKKPAEKKPAAKKPVAKKAPAKKPAAKKVAEKKPADKKPAAKKAAPQKADGKKAVEKQPAAKKAATPKPAAKKPVAKATAAKKAPAPKAPLKKAPEKPDPTVTKLKEGMAAPKFHLPATTGVDINLADFKNQLVVLYFYPKDDTPGCTIEAKDFQDLKGQFTRLGAFVMGISPNDLDSHNKFCRKYKLSFPLLADVDSKVASKYDVWKEKAIFGKKFMGIARTTFIIGRDGKIKKVFTKVKVAGHAKKVLAALKEVLKD